METTPLILCSSKLTPTLVNKLHNKETSPTIHRKYKSFPLYGTNSSRQTAKVSLQSAVHVMLNLSNIDARLNRKISRVKSPSSSGSSFKDHSESGFQLLIDLSQEMDGGGGGGVRSSPINYRKDLNLKLIFRV